MCVLLLLLIILYRCVCVCLCCFFCDRVCLCCPFFVGDGGGVIPVYPIINVSNHTCTVDSSYSIFQDSHPEIWKNGNTSSTSSSKHRPQGSKQQNTSLHTWTLSFQQHHPPPLSPPYHHPHPRQQFHRHHHHHSHHQHPHLGQQGGKR